MLTRLRNKLFWLWYPLRAVVSWLGRRLRLVIRDENGAPYLIRYRLLPWGPYRVYLHHIVQSDADRHLHDHPFDFWSLILWGGYFEELAIPQSDGRLQHCLTRWRGPGTLLRRKAEHAHRLLLATQTRFSDTGYGMYHQSAAAWTLVFRGPRRRDWGFYLTDENPVRWVPWTEYRKALQLREMQ